MAYLILRRSVMLFNLIILLEIPQVQGQGECYYPSGHLTDQRPCDPNAYTSLCCPVGFTCFSNDICVATDQTVLGSSVPPGTTLRGGCTNPEWNNAVCGDYCLDDTDEASTLQSCGDGNWCCQSGLADGTCNCSNMEGTFTIPNGKAQTIIGISSLLNTATFFSVAGSTAPASATAAASASPSTTLTTSALSVSSSAGTKSATSSQSQSSQTSSPSSTSVTTSSSTTSPTSTPSSIPITQTARFKDSIAAVSVVLGLILISVVAYFAYGRWRRGHKFQAAAQYDNDDDSEFFRMQERHTAVPIIRIDPDPYQPPGHYSRVASPNDFFDASTGSSRSRFSPPAAVDPYRPPMPYEGT